MFQQVELISIGLAAVIDAVLLLAIIERRNRIRVAVPIALLVAGTTMLHGGAFVRLLLLDLKGTWAEQVHWAALLVLTVGLLLIPAAMTHCCWRLLRTGLAVDPPFARRYLAAYLPLFALLPTALTLPDDPRNDYLTAMRPLIVPYAVWAIGVGFAATVGFFFYRGRTTGRTRQFCTTMGVLQLFEATVQTGLLLAAFRVGPDDRSPLQLISLLLPVLSVLLFGYFVLRYNFMQLMLERTLVYAAVLVGFMLFHHVTVLGLRAELEDRYRVDFGILEALLIVALIVVYQPLRQRVGESLRYLVGARVDALRERTRALAWQLSSRSGDDPQELITWFRREAAQAGGVPFISAWLFDSGGRITLRGSEPGRVSDVLAVDLYRELCRAGEHIATPRSPLRPVACLLLDLEASLAVRLDQPTASGLFIFGRPAGNTEFAQEESNALVLLVEQLGIVLHNNCLQTERLLAERRALQNEKLSTLGLLAGSIAHEIKNPLSSIKTLATVMAEDLGPASSHTEDLRLILGEVNRLSTITNQLLSFVRPAPSTPLGCAVGPLIETTLSVMRHWAHERGVAVRLMLDDGAVCVAADEASLREVFFNLIKNAVEAAPGNGCVTVRTGIETTTDGLQQVVVEIQDDGPGLPPEVQDRLFEPFVTTKVAGTGLGLYLVGRQIRAAGGQILCRSSPQTGTLFTITLPVAQLAVETS